MCVKTCVYVQREEESHAGLWVCVYVFNSCSKRMANSLRLCSDSLINDPEPDLKQQATGWGQRHLFLPSTFSLWICFLFVFSSFLPHSFFCLCIFEPLPSPLCLTKFNFMFSSPYFAPLTTLFLFLFCLPLSFSSVFVSSKSSCLLPFSESVHLFSWLSGFWNQWIFFQSHYIILLVFWPWHCISFIKTFCYNQDSKTFGRRFLNRTRWESVIPIAQHDHEGTIVSLTVSQHIYIGWSISSVGSGTNMQEARGL